ncbi:MAG: 16S rRNA (guanine(527)-N(7))-methyltransferase RsmG [Acidobacteriota bacterium]
MTALEVEEILRSIGLSVSGGEASQVAAYVALLQKWNARLNLTGLEDSRDMVITHFGEARLAASQLLDEDKVLLDVGSGAGFPGLAMKLFRPRLGVQLVEARKKRAAFLATVRRELRLEAVRIVEKMIEDCDLVDTGLAADVVTCRAVGRMVQVVRAALRLTKSDARVLLFLTERQVKEASTGLPELEWQDAIPIPWSQARLLLPGRRKPELVPRGTQG